MFTTCKGRPECTFRVICWDRVVLHDVGRIQVSYGSAMLQDALRHTQYHRAWRSRLSVSDVWEDCRLRVEARKHPSQSLNIGVASTLRRSSPGVDGAIWAPLAFLLHSNCLSGGFTPLCCHPVGCQLPLLNMRAAVAYSASPPSSRGNVYTSLSLLLPLQC